MGTVRKALQLLDILARPDADPGLTDIARLSGHDKATTRRLLLSLMADGFVEQDATSRAYRLGPALLMFGRAREDRFPFFKTVMPTVQALAQASGETAHACEYSAGAMNSVCSQPSDKSNRVIVQVGERFALHATASGLAFLAASADSVVTPHTAYTDTTLVTPDALRAQISAARAKGYAICNQFREVGVHSVATAILTPAGTPIGSIAIAMPSARAGANQIATAGNLVAQAAKTISARLFGQPTPPGMRHP